MDADELINRIKKLNWYEVTIPVPPLFSLTGTVPFTFKIVDNRAVCRVLAISLVEAEARVLEYFNGQV